MKRFNKSLIWIALALLAGTALAGRGDSQLPFTEDLFADGQLAQEQQLPVMVVFVSEHCGYCAALESDYIKPMLKSGEYDDKVIIRVLNIDYSDVVSFQGKTLSGVMLANNLGAFVTPTIMFFDHQGNEVAEKIMGYSTPGLFGGVLDQAIDESLSKVRQDTELAHR